LLAALGSIVVLERWGRRLFAGTSHGWLLGGLPALVFAAMPSQARYVVSAMETLLFVFLVLWASYLLLARERAVAAGVVFALAAMTRPEGGLYWLVATAIAVLRPAVAGRLRPAAAALGAFVVVYVPYFLWRYGYYDQLLPNTFYAKAAEPSWERVARGLRQLGRLVSSWSLLPPLLLALPSLAQLSRRAIAFAWASVAATLAYFLFVGGDVLSFFGPRFLMPALPGLLLLAAVGVERVTVLLPRVRWRLAALVLAALALLGNALAYSWPADPSVLDDLRVEGEAQTRLAEWMLEHTPPGTVFATPAAGIVPFLTGRPTIDMYGLNDAHIAHRRVPPGAAGKAGHEKHDARYVLDRRPDLVLTSLSRRGLPHSAGLREVAARFRACYELIALVRVQKGPPGDGRWVVPVTDFVPQLWQAGYSDGLFRRRTGSGEACRSDGS
jgi:hypothetical protein